MREGAIQPCPSATLAERYFLFWHDVPLHRRDQGSKGDTSIFDDDDVDVDDDDV